MKRALFVLLFVFVLVASLDSVSAIPCGRCSLVKQTTAAWGIGSTCAAARQNGYDTAVANAGCDICYEEVFYYDCWWDGQNGRYQVTVNLTYRCWIEIDPCGPPVP